MKLNTIYNEDCLETMKRMPDNFIDLVLTDPPYGIDIGKMSFANSRGGKPSKNALAKRREYSSDKSWDSVRISIEYFDEMRRVANNLIVWGGNYYIDYLGATRCMLVWYKRDGLPTRSFADCEIAWTSFDKNSMVFNCRWDGFIRDSREPKVAHPTQKALEVMKWCVSDFSKEGDTIYDPFMGSGTTAKACQDLNRNYIGSEISKEYCDIAEERLKQGVLL